LQVWYNNSMCEMGECGVPEIRDDSLLEKLLWVNTERIPMHMPGHKRNSGLSGQGGYLSRLPVFADITEIEGFDDLNDPETLFADCMRRASQLWKSDETLFSVNGSTGGILAAIYASVPQGEKVIVARNCHRSVCHALELRGVNPVWLLPKEDRESGLRECVQPDVVEKLLRHHPDAALVVVTSPTYEGVTSDIASIARACHALGVPLLVDEAHGAHFGFGHGFPEGAIAQGADIVVQSLHKTLAGFTQTGLVHLNGNLVDRGKIRRAMAVFQSSSPSYILSASIDGCVRLLEARGDELFRAWQENLARFLGKAAGLHRIGLLSATHSTAALDPSKIVLLTRNTGLTGPELMDRLRREYRIEPEMAAPAHVVAMTGIGDTQETLTAFAEALLAIDRACPGGENPPPLPEFILPETILPPAEAVSLPQRQVPLRQSGGQVSAAYAAAYPPGAPLLVPGERIEEPLIRMILEYERRGVRVRGPGLPETIAVIK